MKVKSRTIFIIIGIVVFIFLLLNGGSRTMMRRYWELHKLSDELAQLKKQNGLWRKEIYFLENDLSYIEYTARKDLGLNSPGEIEYRFKR